MESKVTDEMNEFLLTDFISEEILTAIKQMHPLKAPRLDGTHALFFFKNIGI